jgi:GeoRSP system PqqD family protein
MSEAGAEKRLVRHSERVAARVMDGKAVVVVIDTRKLHVMNPVGTRVWELCDGRTVAEIIDSIVAEFEVDRVDAERDVAVFLEQLEAVGAVEMSRD